MTREQLLEESLRNLIATIELHTDCMDGSIDREALDDYIEEAENALGYTVGFGDNLFAISWVDASRRLPDSDTTVLVAMCDSAEPVWLGFYNGEMWASVDGFPINVSHWADLPESPDPDFPTTPTKGEKA